ncbi:MAG: GGDEF domain-containing protein [Chloroflexi bacterium]|nr:GGDEF domain-containing protein [Chloroflexota bacterium]
MSLKTSWSGDAPLAWDGWQGMGADRASRSPIDPGPPTRKRRSPGVATAAAARTPAEAIERARDALLTAIPRLELRDPMLPSALRFALDHGHDILPSPLLGAWRTRMLASGAPDRDLPWSLGFDAAPNSPAYDPTDGVGALWRPRERDWLERDATAFGHRLLAPIALAENVDFLARLRDAADPSVARTADEILSELQPRMEADLATAIHGGDPWRDTFAIWLLARRPEALALLHPIAFAITTRYGTLASRLAGLVCGVRYPFEAVPLVSANAHLGSALWRLDYRPSLLPGIVAFVAARRTRDGGFADESQGADVLTTLAAADLLATLDPAFDPAPTMAWFTAAQERDGWWRALDPEVPWLTATIVEWLELASRPFAERFRWPAYQRTELDRKTGIPGYAAFDRLARVFETLPSIANAPVSIAFGDLAGFREFNTAHGQGMGDRVLRTFATALSEIDASLSVRDGGDEFLVVGAPGRESLMTDLEAFRSRWPARFDREYGSAMGAVAPRLLLADAHGRNLRAMRDRLGQGIAGLKAAVPDPPPEGVLSILRP